MNFSKLLHTVRIRLHRAFRGREDDLSLKLKRQEREKRRKRRARRTGEPRRRFAIGIGRGFWGYLALLVVGILFSQALNSSLSAVFLTFLIVWPILDIIYLIVIFASVDANVRHDDLNVIKNKPTDFTVQVVNNSPFPIPFAEADFLLPAKNSVRCLLKRIPIAAAPNSDYRINSSVTFSYRGTYDIGVECIYVYDLFRMLRLRVRLCNYRSIYVLPRRFSMNASPDRACSDISTEVKRTVLGADRNDVSEVRQYQPGDSMKSVHWKLSSKAVELQVKKYDMNSGKTVYLLCDMAAHFDIEGTEELEEDINEFAVDGVVELALSLASKIILEGNVCVPVWYDERGEGGIRAYPCATGEELEGVLRMLATAPVCDGEYRVGKLSSVINETQAATLIYVTSYPDADFLGDAVLSASLIGGTGSRVEAYYYNPLEKVKDEALREEKKMYFERCKRVLVSHNINVTETTAEECSVNS